MSLRIFEFAICGSANLNFKKFVGLPLVNAVLNAALSVYHAPIPLNYSIINNVKYIFLIDFKEKIISLNLTLIQKGLQLSP
jgi:hypothetical protein